MRRRPSVRSPGSSPADSQRSPELDQALHFSADDVLQHLFVETEVCHEPLEPDILLLELLQPLRLRRHQSAIFAPPSIVGLNRYAGFAAHLLDGRTILGLLENERDLVHAVIRTPHIQDRDGVPMVLREIIARFWYLRHVFANGGYAGDKLRKALRRMAKWTIEISKRSDTAKGFEVLPGRWVVERTLAWLNRNRCLAEDFEKTIASAKAWVFIPPVQIVIRRIARL